MLKGVFHSYQVVASDCLWGMLTKRQLWRIMWCFVKRTRVIKLLGIITERIDVRRGISVQIRFGRYQEVSSRPTEWTMPHPVDSKGPVHCKHGVLPVFELPDISYLFPCSALLSIQSLQEITFLSLYLHSSSCSKNLTRLGPENKGLRLPFEIQSICFSSIPNKFVFIDKCYVFKFIPS